MWNSTRTMARDILALNKEMNDNAETVKKEQDEAFRSLSWQLNQISGAQKQMAGYAQKNKEDMETGLQEVQSHNRALYEQMAGVEHSITVKYEALSGQLRESDSEMKAYMEAIHAQLLEMKGQLQALDGQILSLQNEIASERKEQKHDYEELSKNIAVLENSIRLLIAQNLLNEMEPDKK